MTYSKTEDDHKRHVRTMLEVLRKNQLYAKMSKCIFAVPQVDYLGHIILGQGVATNPSKVKDMMEWPIPKNITQIRGFFRANRIL